MGSPDLATGLRAPRQQRSRDTTARILTAARRMLREGTFDRVSVGDLARAAGVSVGGFYARFENKRALLIAFEAQILDAARRRLHEVLAPERWAGAGVAAIVEAYVRLVLETFAAEPDLMREIVVHARDRERGTTGQTRQFNDEAHGTLRRLLLARRDEIRHPDPERAVDFGVMLVSSALREMVLFGDHRLHATTIDVTTGGEELVGELTRAWCGYLGVEFQHEES